MLEVKNLTVAFDDKTVIAAVSLRLQRGNIGCLLGPSGCGKTTLLRTIAGFEQPGTGEVWLNDRMASSPNALLQVEQRGVGMVFQDFALFPHLTAEDNIAFGLQCLPDAARQTRIDEVVQMLAIADFRHKHPHQLSGGQQQRVAIARALAPRPHLLLLDEPFSNMDVELREQIARELRTILKQDGMTAILVTHNQLEAFAMADEIGVIRDGGLLQWDSAFNLYHRPSGPQVADFIGEGVFLDGIAISPTQIKTELGVLTGAAPHGHAPQTQVSVLIRPDDIVHDDNSKQTATVRDKVFRGAEFLYTLTLPNGTRILSLVPSHHDHAIGEDIGIRPQLDHLVLFQSDIAM
ncbi:MAG: ABC transporter ATP-binding protein [Gammaproteobacteria bacterium]|nr:ABC transporter ATP-binding protein [Gammaproteobacteria bacterium]MCY4209932.1 ABC transporter ATP-binding protein [Gammaproteobacteria bacterium]MCY4281457.1 ABC transporter ATP-binding protein [Gammaproteobacteria bacterium]MCY4338664.1 ABC transporter ATP-binding protein [Gammaproteobacteria bacterium]